MSEENQNLLPNRQDSFYTPVEEGDDLQPHELSGDESAEQSVISSEIAEGGKSSNNLITFFRFHVNCHDNHEDCHRSRYHRASQYYQ